MDPNYARGFEVAVTYFAGLTAGGAAYISLIEAPARAKLSPGEQLKHWRTTFTPAKNFFQPAGMVIVPALVACAQVTATPLSAKLYYASALPFALLGPFTAVVIAATNTKLLESEAPSSPEAEEKISGLVSLWAKRHGLRTVMTLSGFALAMSACSFIRK